MERGAAAAAAAAVAGANNILPAAEHPGAPKLTALSRYRALVLDSTYQPIDVVNWQRAICMEIATKVDVLEYYEDVTVKAPRDEFLLPVSGPGLWGVLFCCPATSHCTTCCSALLGHCSSCTAAARRAGCMHSVACACRPAPPTSGLPPQAVLRVPSHRRQRTGVRISLNRYNIFRRDSFQWWVLLRGGRRRGWARQ